MYAEHLTHRSLWNAAQRLREDARASEIGSTWRLLGAALCAYFALEGFLNYLGEMIATDEWAREREIFSSRPYKGTLGKLRLLAEKCDLPIERGVRPYQTIRQLELVRHELVHPRPVYGAPDWDPDGRPRLPEPDALKTLEAKGFVDRALADAEALADSLLEAAKGRFPLDLQRAGSRAFQGSTATMTWWGGSGEGAG